MGTNYDNNDCFINLNIAFKEKIHSIRYSRNGRFLLCLITSDSNNWMSSKYSMIIYDCEDNCETACINLSDKPDDYICFDSDGSNYLIVQFNRSVQLWNIDTKQDCGNIGITRSFITGINNIAVSNDGKYLGVVALDKTITASNATFVRIFDIKEGIKIYESKHGYVNSPVEKICFSPNNQYAVISLMDSSGKLILKILRKTEENTYAEDNAYLVSIGQPYKMLFHPNGKSIYLGEKSGVRIVNKKRCKDRGDVVIYDFVNKKLDKFINHNIEGTLLAEYDFELNKEATIILTKTDSTFRLFDNSSGKLIIDLSKDVNSAYQDLNIVSATLHPIKDYVTVCLSDNSIRNITIHGQDELFEVEKDFYDGFITFTNTGSKEYKKPLGCFASCLVTIAFICFACLVIAMIGEELAPYFSVALLAGVIIYKIYRDRKID